MPKSSPKQGGTYTYEGERIGQRDDTALYPGTVVTVREVVPADVKGAHNDNEDAVVIEWEAEGQIIVETKFEKRAAPVIATSDDGNVLMDADNNPVFKLQTQEVPVHTFGTGSVPRAMSFGVKQFAADFKEA